MDLRVLDKDLDRIANAESAGIQTRGPVIRLGIAMTFAALVTVVGAGMAGVAAPGVMAAGVMVAAFLALSIGANDVANALGPAVGARAIPMGVGLAAVALAEIAGALAAGGRVSQTLSTGILSPDLMVQGAAPGTVMLAAMLAAAIWITLATWAGAPVSTTHAIVGGIAGAGVAVFGAGAPDWPAILQIAAGWVVSPIIAALIGAAALALLRARVHRAPDRIDAAARWLPRVVAAMAAVLSLYALTLTGADALLAGVTGAMAAGAGWVWAARRIARERAAGHRAAQMLDRLFGPPLVAGALLIAFGHGANDVGNIVAPLAVIALSAADWQPAATMPPAMLATGAIGIALGAALFGRRLVRMVGSRITRLNPARALCVSLATALTVLGATWMALPVSTTHVTVGGVFGVGFYREWEERRHRRAEARKPLPPEELDRRRLVRRATVLRTLAAWAVTVPVTGMMAAAIAWVIG